ALAAMEDRRPWLLVVGKDRWQQAMEKLAAKLGVAGRVRFLGGLKDVAPLYGAADLFCLPTLYDPFPNAAMEALAAGLPVVTTRNSGAAELIRPGQNGLVCEAADAAGLAAALDELSAPGRAASLSPAARASALPWPVADTAQRLIALYRSVGA
ncbi:MAG: glycosyltransferase family 4 protein, partial [Rhodocyclaceae bacterium]|nr:glycosyltransferase family 4 protein [Rhodocyclaceae bacterium]